MAFSQEYVLLSYLSATLTRAPQPTAENRRQNKRREIALIFFLLGVFIFLGLLNTNEFPWCFQGFLPFFQCCSEVVEARKGTPKNLSSQVWANFGCTFGVNSYKNPSICECKVRIVQKILGKASDDSLLLKDFFGSQGLEGSKIPWCFGGFSF